MHNCLLKRDARSCVRPFFALAGGQVPTALLLERPLVMSSTLLDAYPCLRKSPIHSTVSEQIVWTFVGTFVSVAA